jgi:hypothetical protein
MNARILHTTPLIMGLAPMGSFSTFGQATPIGPFTGPLSESFESFPNYKTGSFNSPAIWRSTK